MQEIVLLFSSLAGVATAVAIKTMPRNKNRSTLGANVQIKSKINSLRIEKDILDKTISRLYQNESEFSEIQRDKLLSRYQHQQGVVLAKLDRLEQTSKHPDLGVLGDGLITLMDQKLSKLDDRLSEMSTKLSSTREPKVQEKPIPVKPQTISQTISQTELVTPQADTRPRESFEITTLTSTQKTNLRFPELEKPAQSPGMVQQVFPTDTAEKIINTVPPKVISPAPIVKTQSEITPVPEKTLLSDDAKSQPLDASSDDENLDKIKADIMKVLEKLEQSEVE